MGERRVLAVLAALLLFILGGCQGYRPPEDFAPLSHQALYIAPLRGDEEGAATQAIVHAVGAAGLAPGGRDSPLRLEGELLPSRKEYLGYRYDRTAISGRRLQRLVPTEGAHRLTARISLVEGATGRLLLGPYEVEGYSEFDFINENTLRDLACVTPGGEIDSLLFFSLGQLDAEAGASSSAEASLYRNLAQKVAHTLLHAMVDAGLASRSPSTLQLSERP